MTATFAEKKSASSATTKTIQPFFSAANMVQRQPGDSTNIHQVDPADVTNYLSMIDLDAANKSNIKNLNQFSNERYLLSLFLNVPLTVTTSKPASNQEEDISPLTLAIASWQYDYTNDTSGKFKKEKSTITKVNGKYKDSINALVENGFDPKGKTQDWASIDHKDAREVLDAEKEHKEAAAQMNNTEDAMRQAIVNLATSQQGTVVAVDRGDGSKFGWERIARFYEVAQDKPDQFNRKREEGVPTDIPKGGDITTSKITGIKAANKFANNKTGDWSWCGIFTVWAIRTITGKGTWDSGPQGFGAIKTEVKKARKGDIINIKSSSNPNNHHIILAEDIPADAPENYTIYAVEGNIDLQGIKATHRWKVSDINGYYQAI